MTIAQAFNEITVAQGGTPNYSGTISGAIDALNDALAGSDQPSAQTIEGAVRLLGQHIGGGGGGSCMVYVAEVADGTPQEPQGTIKVGDTTYTSSETSSVMGLTVYGYELPSGAIIEYRAPAGYEPNTVTGEVCTFYAFSDVEAMQTFTGESLMEVAMKKTGVGGYIAASGPSGCVCLMLLSIFSEA